MVPLKINLPEGFLNEETRCGFTVTRQLKEVWAVELDLLVEFDRVCKKHGIRYVASGGTILGAVRHHGFIPWDDDLDLMMPRADYEQLCAVAQDEFKDTYFFQTEYTDPGFMRGFARLRNSQTAGIQCFEFNKRYRFNQGIFIDIFPMDEVVDDDQLLSQQNHKAKKLFAKACILSEMTDRFPPDRKPTWKYAYKLFGHYLFGSFIRQYHLQDRYLKKFERTCAQYNGTGQKRWSLLSFQFSNRGHDLSVYSEDGIISLDFEFVQMPVPKDFDAHLKNKYGDYMTPKQIANYHGDVIFDTDRSYTVILADK
ncbi:MAG: LicD family protein [Prevotella sp.]|nr:LicD family protein [Prevotella sp.]